MSTAPLHIVLTAGEASGDLLGARLMAAIMRECPGAVFSGVGGPLMTAQGLRSLFPARDLAVMGVAEVLPRLPLLLRRIAQTVDHVRQAAPAALVTIDSPDFSFRVASRLRAAGEPLSPMIHYVAPTVWAWRPERAAKVARLYDGLMCLLPFEPSYFEKEGLRAAWTGHPILESGLGCCDGAGLRRELGIAPDARVLGVLFGSRMGELNRTGPALRAAAEILAARGQAAHILSPTFPALENQVRNLLQRLPCAMHILTDPERKAETFAAMDGALATSGTVGLELAVAGVPHVIAYKMNPLTWEIVRRRITVQYAHLANILLDRPVVPEFIQGDCTGPAIADAFADGLETQRTAFAMLPALLGGTEDGLPPSVQAARFVLEESGFFS